MRALLIGAVALTLSACASTTALTVSQTLEKGDTDAALAYAAVADSVNAAEAAHPVGVVADEALKLKAWQLYGEEHSAYLAGQSFDISGLLALVAAAKAL